GSGERRDQPLHPLLDETLAMLRATLPASVSLQARLGEPPLFVHADATQLQQVVMNLCTNAWQSLDGRPGRIEVGLLALTVDGHAGAADRPAGLAPGAYAHRWVADTGSGMDAATRAHIFEPFFTTKPEGQGTGLGLAMVHGIVAAHSGVVTVDTALGHGSTFHVYLPLVHPDDAASPAEPQALSAAPPGQGQHVLYVDDDEVMVLLAEQLLRHLGYRVSGFHDPREAVAAVRERGGEFDLVVTDYNMPAMSGLDVARAVAEAQPGLPVVIGSGRVPEELRHVVGVGNVGGIVHKEQMVEQLGAVVARTLAARGAAAPARQDAASSAMKS
ncbi:MAG TPA: ATP-binding protein, partial [Ideonella sp.]|nr:ATP-binding protein [Ideonella sp.]